MHFQKVLLEEVDEVEMQLQNIDTGKLDYSLRRVKFVANSRGKSMNDLSMYGSAMVPAKSTPWPNLRKLTKSDPGMKTRMVSGIYYVIFLLNLMVPK